MPTGSVIEIDHSQVVLLPAETHFPRGVRQVSVRVVGPDLVLSPVDRTWDTFFSEGPASADDRLPERAEQGPPQGREPIQ